MQTIYEIFKFLHIAAVIVWIGGVVGISVANARVARSSDRSATAALTEASAFFGRAVAGPSAVLTLVAGVVMVLTASVSFATLWIA